MGGFACNGFSIATGNDGRAIITWTQYDGDLSDQVYKSEYQSGAWVHPTGLSNSISIDDVYSFNPKVAMNDQGSAIISWIQNDGSFNQLFKSELRNSLWAHPSSILDNISPDGTNVSNFSLAMDNNHNAVIAWTQNSGGSQEEVYKSELKNSVWTHPANLSDSFTTSSSGVTNPSVIMSSIDEYSILYVEGVTTSISRILNGTPEQKQSIIGSNYAASTNENGDIIVSTTFNPNSGQINSGVLFKQFLK
jgi:hypothetical protein